MKFLTPYFALLLIIGSTFAEIVATIPLGFGNNATWFSPQYYNGYILASFGEYSLNVRGTQSPSGNQRLLSGLALYERKKCIFSIIYEVFLLRKPFIFL